MRLSASVFALLSCVACGGPPAAPPPPPSDPLVNRVWTPVESDGRPGVMLAFLDSGVLIQDSCWETYRLSQWRRLDDARVLWSEDGMEIEARVEHAVDGAMTLRLALGAEERAETYRLAATPFVCPDLEL